MFEDRDSRIFRAIFLFTTVLYLLFSGMEALAFEKVDQSNLPEWAGGWTHINPDPNGQASMWQTFTPEYSNVTVVEIDIMTANPGRGDDTLTVEIAKDGEILALVVRYVEDGFEGLLRFEFDEAVAVVPGELYELRVHGTGLTRFGWKYASNTYEAGSRYVSANEHTGSDWLFQTYATVEPRIIYVDDDAAGANDGSSWENAYVYLQDALADANSAEKPVEIRVAQGIYKPDQGANQMAGDQDATFHLINSVTLKGGYAGFGETDPNERNVDKYVTVLSGDLDDNDNVNDEPPFDWEKSKRENSYHVITNIDTDETVLLDGFTIFGGGVGYWSAESGGGMITQRGSPTIINCSFTNCSALDGGAMFNEDSHLNIINSTFIHNLAYMGAGMQNIRSDLTLSGCVFNDNSVFYGNFQTTEPWWGWIDIYFAPGGGGMRNVSSQVKLNDCLFTSNTAEQGGGLSNHDSNPILVNCTLTNNSSSCYLHNGLSYGGGIRNVSSSPTLTNCTFSNNSSAWAGGGMYNGGSSNPTLTNCTFSRNSAQVEGGGIYNYMECNPVLLNCTFAQNTAGYGKALACDSHQQEAPSNVELINCILWDGGDEIWNNDCSIIDISYSDIQGGQASIFDPCEAVIWGEGNIDVDPDFVRAGYWTEPSPRQPNSSVWIEGDYHLKSEAGRWDPVSDSWIIDNVTSPCIDAGDPNSPVGDEPDPNGGRINMGAYGGTAEASKSPGYSWFFETTQGAIPTKGLGIVLPHEHIFTDLRGPTTPGYGQADAADVVRVMAPLLSDAREKGVGVFIECSSIGVGRNVSIIAQVVEASGLPVVVPTGVYGRANFAPPEHRNMTEDELTTLFVSEIRDGIEGTGIKAGFIKIATDDGPMNALLEKILRAAGRAASETGAAIASHTPAGSNAVRQVDILDSIDPAIRFIWVHAQNESNRNIHLQLAARGVYIEFDSLGWNPSQDSTYISAIKNLLAAGHGDRILLSHDAGWYQPGSVNGGTQKPFTYLIDTFIPTLRDAGVDDATIRMITQTNPVRAFGFKSD